MVGMPGLWPGLLVIRLEDRGERGWMWGDQGGWWVGGERDAIQLHNTIPIHV